MKKSIFKLISYAVIFLSLVFSVSAAALTIPEARTSPAGSEVTVNGYAFSATDTPGTGFINEFYLNDAKAQGICVVPSTGTSVTLLSGYSVTGTLSEENGELKTTTKAVTLTVPAGESITFTAEQLYGYAGGPDLEIATAGWSMAANDFAYAYHPYGEDGEEYIEFKDMYTVDVREDAPVNKTFKIKAFTQDGSNKNIQITIKVGEPL